MRDEIQDLIQMKANFNDAHTQNSSEPQFAQAGDRVYTTISTLKPVLFV